MAQLDPGLEQPRPGQAGDDPVATRDGLDLLTGVRVRDTALLGSVVTVACQSGRVNLIRLGKTESTAPTFLDFYQVVKKTKKDHFWTRIIPPFSLYGL